MCRYLLALLAFAAFLVPTQLQGQTIFVSTFTGHQILRIVAGGEGASVSVINTDSSALPEGIALGPDGKLYVCDSVNDRIRRIDLTTEGLTVEVVKPATTNPSGPEGPSFNSNRDLYFNTRGPESHTGVWKIPFSQLNPIPAGGATPVNVLTAAQTGSTFGEGTTFDGSDNLLVVDRSGNRVLISSPPYSTVSPLITGLNSPLGIAVNSLGRIFVADSGSNSIKVFDGVSLNTYVTFTAPDAPSFMKFDASDRLFVVTSRSVTAAGGKVWRVDPSDGGTGTKTLIKDLTTVDCSTGTCLPVQSPGYAVGLALAPTSSREFVQPLNPNGGINTYINGSYKWRTKYSANPAFAGVDLGVTFNLMNDAQFRLQVASSNDPAIRNSQCIVYGGADGFCVRITARCKSGGLVVPCPNIPPDPTNDVLTSYNSQVFQNNPGFLQKEGAVIRDVLRRFLQNRIDPTDCANPDPSWSDWIAVDKPTSPFSSFTVPQVAVALAQNAFATAGLFTVTQPLTLPQNVLFRFGGVTVFVGADSFRPTGTGGFFFIGKMQDMWVVVVLQPIGMNQFRFVVAERGGTLALTGTETTAPFQLTVGSNSDTAPDVPILFFDGLDF